MESSFKTRVEEKKQQPRIIGEKYVLVHIMEKRKVLFPGTAEAIRRVPPPCAQALSSLTVVKLMPVTLRQYRLCGDTGDKLSGF